MHAVFLDNQTFHASIEFSKIAQSVERFTCYPLTSETQIVERAIDADIIITNKVMLSKDILNQLPQLKLVCISATGTNNVDLVHARKLGICVTNVSGYAKQAVSQYVLAQILNYYCNLAQHNQVTINQIWQKSPTFCVHGNSMTELAGKTLGIYGYGTLGKAVAQLAQAFGMKILVSENTNNAIIREGRVSFNAMLAQADIVSLHCPQNEHTTGLFNQKTFSQMKNTSLLINTARGGIINSNALATALKEGEIAHAIVDVLEQEPPPEDHPLLDKSIHNITITAHMAWASIEAQERLITLLAQNIENFQQGAPKNLVN